MTQLGMVVSLGVTVCAVTPAPPPEGVACSAHQLASVAMVWAW